MHTVFHEIGHAASDQAGFTLPLDEMLQARRRLEGYLGAFGDESDPIIDKFLQYAGLTEKHADSFAQAALGESNLRVLSPYTPIGEILDSPVFKRDAHLELVRVGRVRPDLRLGVGGYINSGMHYRDLESLVRPSR